METTQQILDQFYTFVGDTTGLSSTEALALLQKQYDLINNERAWNYLKAEHNVFVPNDTVDLPADFRQFSGRDALLYVGANQREVLVVPWEERRIYSNGIGRYAYLDIANDVIRSYVPFEDTVSFDYVFNPPLLDLEGSNPVYPRQYRHALYHSMCIDDDIIQLSEKARSYQQENAARARQVMQQMRSWDLSISNMKSYGT